MKTIIVKSLLSVGLCLLPWLDARASEINWDTREAMELAKPIELSVSAKVQTEVAYATPEDDAADDPAIWYNEKTPQKSIIYGTNKKAGIDVFTLSGERIQFLEEGLINNIDVRYRITLGKRTLDIAGASNRTHHSIDIYEIDAKTGRLTLLVRQKVSREIDEIYGFCLGFSFETNSAWAFANGKNGVIEQYALSENNGDATLKHVRTLRVPSKPEGMVCDDLLKTVYVGEENHGIWKFDALATGSTEGKLIESTRIEKNANLQADIEGISIFYANSTQGYLIASVQGNNSYALFRRSENNEYIGSFSIKQNSDIDGVEETDGLDVINLALGETFPAGLLVVQDGYNFDSEGQPQAQNFKLIDWSTISEALGLINAPENKTWMDGIVTQ